MVVIELSKLNEILNKPVEKLNAFEMWSLFFKYAPDPVHRNKINDIITVKEEISMATTLLREISQDERERAINRSRRMYETDRISDYLTAVEIGEQRGEIREREKWQIIAADKDAEIARLRAELLQKRNEK
jgi:PAB1-binding protein PBP1